MDVGEAMTCGCQGSKKKKKNIKTGSFEMFLELPGPACSSHCCISSG